MKTKQLPEGWKEVELGKIIKLRGGYAFKSEKFVNDGTPIIRISNFNNNDVDLTDVVYYPKSESEKYKEFFLKENDVLIAMSGATTGKIGVIIKKNLPCLLNQRVGKFEVIDKNLYWKYLLYYVKSRNFQKTVYDIASGCAQPNISSKQIESIAIPLPPLPTQKRIVSILEKAEALKQKRDEADLLTKEYLQSVFYEMFLNKNFSLEKLKKLTIKIENKNPINEFPEDYFNYIDISSVNNDTKRIVSTSKLLGKEAPSRARQQVKTKDIILSTVRPNLNAVALIPRELNNQICSTGFCVLRLDKDRVTAEYVFMNLTGNKFIGSMTKIAKGSSYPGISNSDILDFQIPLPPLPLQQKFANIVEHVEGLKEKQKKSKDELNLLFDALMQKAFNGELVK